MVSLGVLGSSIGGAGLCRENAAEGDNHASQQKQDQHPLSPPCDMRLHAGPARGAMMGRTHHLARNAEVRVGSIATAWLGQRQDDEGIEERATGGRVGGGVQRRRLNNESDHDNRARKWP